MPTTRVATKSRTRPDTYYVRAQMSAKTLARIKRIMAELNWDAVQVIECGVDLLYTGTTRKDIHAHALAPARRKPPTKKGHPTP
jgi:hypothetical protein